MLDWLNPLHGSGYQFWSGIGSELPIIAATLYFIRHHNCDTSGCLRLGYFDPVTRATVCRKHQIKL